MKWECPVLDSVYPESPRWLLVKGRYKEAEQVIRHIANINNIELPDDLKLSTLVTVGLRYILVHWG